MSGSHLIRRLRNLDLESSEELELSTDPGPPKSPTKSPTKTKSSVSRSSAFHPYNLSASSAKEAASSAFHPYNLSASGMLHIMFCFKKNPFSYRLGNNKPKIKTFLLDFCFANVAVFFLHSYNGADESKLFCHFRTRWSYIHAEESSESSRCL